MNGLPQLLALYGEWARLSAIEQRALEQRDWLALGDCQAGKRSLQERILTCRCGCPIESLQSEEIKRILFDLISSEKTNQRLLQEIRKENQRERLALDGSARNLRRIHGSYGQQSLALWQSYS